MRVDFTAFAEDAVFTGSLELDADRLSDVIGDDAGVEIRDVVVVALDDGRTVTTSAVTISRTDFAAISAGGPRGDPARRVPTRRHSVRTRIGPYEIVGDVHAPGSAHTMMGLMGRRIIPLTTATIRYQLGGRAVEQGADALLLNGDRVLWVEPAASREPGPAGLAERPVSLRQPSDLSGGLGG